MGTSVSMREVLSSGLLSVIAFIVSVMTSRVGQNGAEWGLSATMLRVLGHGMLLIHELSLGSMAERPNALALKASVP